MDRTPYETSEEGSIHLEAYKKARAKGVEFDEEDLWYESQARPLPSDVHSDDKVNDQLQQSDCSMSPSPQSGPSQIPFPTQSPERPTAPPPQLPEICSSGRQTNPPLPPNPMTLAEIKEWQAKNQTAHSAHLYSAAKFVMSAITTKLESGHISEDKVIEYLLAAAHENVPLEPHSFKEALASHEARHWKTAMGKEMDDMYANKVWELVNLPNGFIAIGSKWVLKIKLNLDGTIERYKVQLVAQGFAQRPYFDYNKTFASVAKFASLCAIMAIAAIEDMEIHLMDISNAFLNGDLEEEGLP